MILKKYGNRNKKFDEKPLEIRLLAERIKQLRINAGYTSYENFAFDKEISRSQYNRYEKGENITFTTILRLCGLFEITIQEFFSEGFDGLRKTE